MAFICQFTLFYFKNIQSILLLHVYWLNRLSTFRSLPCGHRRRPTYSSWISGVIKITIPFYVFQFKRTIRASLIWSETSNVVSCASTNFPFSSFYSQEYSLNTLHYMKRFSKIWFVLFPAFFLYRKYKAIINPKVNRSIFYILPQWLSECICPKLSQLRFKLLGSHLCSNGTDNFLASFINFSSMFLIAIFYSCLYLSFVCDLFFRFTYWLILKRIRMTSNGMLPSHTSGKTMVR